MGPPVEQRSVESCFADLGAVLGARVEAFAKVGGDVAFYVKGAKPPHWQVTALGGVVVVRPGNPPFPVLTIGIIPWSLTQLVEGRLDVEKAFRLKRMAVEGDLAALQAFVRCFSEEVAA